MYIYAHMHTHTHIHTHIHKHNAHTYMHTTYIHTGPKNPGNKAPPGGDKKPGPGDKKPGTDNQKPAAAHKPGRTASHEKNAPKEVTDYKTVLTEEDIKDFTEVCVCECVYACM